MPVPRPARVDVAPPRERKEAEQLFLSKLEFIEEVIAWTSRSSRFSGPDAEDFASEVLLKMIANDYRVLRRFQGQSRLETYLTTVIHNVASDYRNKLWQRWHSSAAAKRLGKVAEELEFLLYADGYRVDWQGPRGYTEEEVIEVLARRSGLDTNLLAEMVRELPQRLPRQFVGPEALDSIATDERLGNAAESLDRARTMRRVKAALARAMDSLGDDDRLLVRLNFADGLSVARIARILLEPQRRLYGRRDRCLDRLRGLLERDGVTWDDVRSILGWDAPLESVG